MLEAARPSCSTKIQILSWHPTPAAVQSQRLLPRPVHERLILVQGDPAEQRLIPLSHFQQAGLPHLASFITLAMPTYPPRFAGAVQGHGLLPEPVRRRLGLAQGVLPHLAGAHSTGGALLFEELVSRLLLFPFYMSLFGFF